MFKLLLKCIVFVFILAIPEWHVYYAQPTKIMIIGESVAKGHTGSSDASGFRRPLHVMLTGNGYNVDFVGSTSVGKYNDFDRAFEGSAGLFIGGDPDTVKPNNALGKVYGWLKARKPQIVLLYIGTYDVYNDDSSDVTIAKMDSLLDEINEYERDYVTPVKLIIASLVNTGNSGDPQSAFISDYNKKLRTLVLNRKKQSTHPENFIFVDMEKGANIDYSIDDTVPYDDGDKFNEVYPNDNGYIKMAQVWYDVLSDILTPTEPELRLTAPSDSSIIQPSNITFGWDSISGAGITSYRLQIAEDSLFRYLVYENASVSATSFALEDSLMSYSSQYYWRIIAGTNYSKIKKFTTALPTPTNFRAITYAADKVLLSWNDITDDEDGYVIERKYGSGNFELLDSVASNLVLYIDSSLTTDSANTYRVKSFNAFTESEYTNEITVLPTTVDINTDKNSLLPKVFALAQNYPNPFNPTTTINYQLPAAGQVKLTIYDILGNQIATLVNENKPAGYYNVAFNGKNLSSGVYFYEIRVTSEQNKAGLFSSVKKFILMK